MSAAQQVAPGAGARDVSAIELDRRAYRRSRQTRSRLIATASTVIVVLLVVGAAVASPGWDRVRAQFLDPQVAWDSLPDILRGLVLNIEVLAIASVSVVIVGLAIAIVRTTVSPVLAPARIFAAGYTDLFRGIPLIIVLYLVGFGLPGLRLQGIPNSPFILGTIALILTYSAYVSEVFRAGIMAVHPSQWAAARSLGLSYRQALRKVILPQALRTVSPPLLNDFVAMQKDVGLISVLGAVDAVRAAQITTATEANFTPYLVAGALFVLIAVPTTRLADRAARRTRNRERAGGMG